MNPKRVQAKLKAAASAQTRLNAAEEKAATVAAQRDDAVLAASDAGATRAELEAATGLSTARITQVLRRARERVAALDLTLT